LRFARWINDPEMNTAPEAFNDTTEIDSEIEVIIDVLHNDLDSDGDIIWISEVSDPIHGDAVVINSMSGDQLLYTPTSGYFEMDSLTYSIIDEFGGTAIAKVIIYKSNIGVKIENLTSDQFHIYPNPVTDKLTIQSGEIRKQLIDITSINGKLIYSSWMEGTSHQLDLSSLQKGVYFITIRSKDSVNTKKIIKL